MAKNFTFTIPETRHTRSINIHFSAARVPALARPKWQMSASITVMGGLHAGQRSQAGQPHPYFSQIVMTSCTAALNGFRHVAQINALPCSLRVGRYWLTMRAAA